MRSKAIAAMVLIGSCFTAAGAGAQEGDRYRREAETENEHELPGYRPRPLPADTFKPSEEISEDFPVAFPTDI